MIFSSLFFLFLLSFFFFVSCQMDIQCNYELPDKTWTVPDHNNCKKQKEEEVGRVNRVLWSWGATQQGHVGCGGTLSKHPESHWDCGQNPLLHNLQRRTSSLHWAGWQEECVPLLTHARVLWRCMTTHFLENPAPSKTNNRFLHSWLYYIKTGSNKTNSRSVCLAIEGCESHMKKRDRIFKEPE